MTKKENTSISESTFIRAKTLPKDLHIETPINFVFTGFEAVLCLGKNNKWGPVYGTIEPGKSWDDSMRREICEKVGTNVGDLVLVGYIEVYNKGSRSRTPFKEHFVMPVTYSFVTNMLTDWKPTRTRRREVFSPAHTLDVLKDGGDNDQILGIYEYIIGILKREAQVTYQFIPGDILENIPVTSVMTLCRDKQGQFCIVKDGSETFYSLPGGGRSLNETPLECSKRELLEEAMVESCNEKVLGTVLVSFLKDSVCLSKMQQVRYLSDACVIDKFIPYNNGFETDERLFIPLKELGLKVKQLQYPTGVAILDYLKGRE